MLGSSGRTININTYARSYQIVFLRNYVYFDIKQFTIVICVKAALCAIFHRLKFLKIKLNEFLSPDSLEHFLCNLHNKIYVVSYNKLQIDIFV